MPRTQGGEMRVRRSYLISVVSVGLMICLSLVFQVMSAQPVSFPAQAGPIGGIVASPDGRALAAVGDERITVWDVATRRLRLTRKGSRIAFSPDGKTVAVADGPMVRMWDLATGLESATMVGHTDTIESLAFSADGK